MNFKQTRTRILAALSGTVAPVLLRILRDSNRIEVQHVEPYERFRNRGQNFIIAFWHGQMLPILFYIRTGGYYTFISPHRDGEYIARALEGMGHHALRTSLRDRRLRALGEALKLAREGETLAVTPDGPRGPRYRAKDGIVKLSRKTDLPILPVAGVSGRAHVFSSWDRFCMPLPLGTIHVRFGDPLFPDETNDIERDRRRLEERLNRISREAGEGLPGLDEYLEEFRAGSAAGG